MDEKQRIILGLGTGRCGTHALAQLLNRQPEAHVTHEQPPLLPWRHSGGQSPIRSRLERFRRERPEQFIGDVASFYLPYVEEAIAAEPASALSVSSGPARRSSPASAAGSIRSIRCR